jgi:hypothetical protein
MTTVHEIFQELTRDESAEAETTGAEAQETASAAR